MSFGIRPLADKVVIKREEAEEKTSSGLLIASQAKEEPQFATVMAVGPGTESVQMEVKEGDEVVFAKYGGTEIKYEGETYTILSQRDILAVIEK